MAEPLGAMDYGPGCFARTLVLSESGWVPKWLALAPVASSGGRRSVRTRIAAISPLLAQRQVAQTYVVLPHLRELLGSRSGAALPRLQGGQAVQGGLVGAYVYRARTLAPQSGTASPGERLNSRAETSLGTESNISPARESTPNPTPVEPAAVVNLSASSDSHLLSPDQVPIAALHNPAVPLLPDAGVAITGDALFPLAAGFHGLDLIQSTSPAHGSRGGKSTYVATSVLEPLAPTIDWEDWLADESPSALDRSEAFTGHADSIQSPRRENAVYTYRRSRAPEQTSATASENPSTVDASPTRNSPASLVEDAATLSTPALQPTFRPVTQPLGMLEPNDDGSLALRASDASLIRQSGAALPAWSPMQLLVASPMHRRQGLGETEVDGTSLSQSSGPVFASGPMLETESTRTTIASPGTRSPEGPSARAMEPSEPTGVPGKDAAARADWPVLDIVHHIHQEPQRETSRMPMLTSTPAMNALQSLPALGPGEPLAEPVRTVMENLVGRDLGQVRTYVSPIAESVGAEAFTTGNRVVFAPGRMDFRSPKGLALLGHELSHLGQPLGMKSIFEMAESLVPQEVKALQQEVQIEAAFAPAPFTPPTMEFRQMQQAASAAAATGINALTPPSSAGLDAQALGRFITSGGESQNNASPGEATGPMLTGSLNLDQTSPIGQGAARLDQSLQMFASRFSQGERTRPGSQTQLTPAAPPSGAAPDIGELARQVYALLKTQLRAEQERHQVYRR